MTLDPKLSSSLALLCILAICTPLLSQAAIVYTNSALTPSGSSSSVWTSSNGAFSMGFFSLQPGSYHVGIWYASLPPLNQSIIWTANRKQSAPANSTLRFTRDGRLQLTANLSSNSSSNAAAPASLNVIIWQAFSFSGLPVTNASQAELLDSGNFVLRDGTSNVLWQSYDHPTDTLLPGQNFTLSSYNSPTLVPWAGINDPSPSSRYRLIFGSSDARIQLLYQNSMQYWVKPYVDVTTVLSNTRMTMNGIGILSIYNGDGSLVWSSTSSPGSSQSCGSIGVFGEYSFTKLQLGVDGNLRIFTWSSASSTWNIWWRALYLQCDVFGACGDNGICDKDQNSVNVGAGGGCPLVEPDLEKDGICVCPQGFTRNGSNCNPPPSVNYCMQFTSTMEHTSFGEPGATADYSLVTQKKCVDTCAANCNCTAASYDNVTEGCWVYTDTASLFNGLRYYQNNQTSFIKTIDTSAGNSSLPSYAIALIIVASCLIVLLILAGLIRRHQIRSRHPRFKQVFLHPDVLNSVGGPHRFSFEDLYMVTHGFHDENKLGAGGFGSVYKGVFTTPHGPLDVAIKRLDKFHRQSSAEMDNGKEDRDFLAEIEILGSIKHVNVVRLVGFCAVGPERLLVYEYVANGSLTSHILNETSILSWDMRFQIAVSAATGIEYLHTHCPKKIVHMDIKPDNILIDEKFKAKVADFGVSKIMGPERMHITNNTPRGTPTYMAPECYHIGASLTEKADAYSYGVVLLELVSGKRVRKGYHVEDVEETGERGQDHVNETGIAESSSARRRSERRVLSLEKAISEIEKGKWESLVDERLEENYERGDAERIVKIVFWCLQGDPEHRPGMEDLLLMIKGHKAVPWAPLAGLFDAASAGGHDANMRNMPSTANSAMLTQQFLSDGR